MEKLQFAVAQFECYSKDEKICSDFIKCLGYKLEELEVSIVDLTIIANAVLLATRSGASKADICDRQIHN
jgi:hypothetical protein